METAGEQFQKLKKCYFQFRKSNSAFSPHYFCVFSYFSVCERWSIKEYFTFLRDILVVTRVNKSLMCSFCIRNLPNIYHARIFIKYVIKISDSSQKHCLLVRFPIWNHLYNTPNIINHKCYIFKHRTTEHECSGYVIVSYGFLDSLAQFQKPPEHKKKILAYLKKLSTNLFPLEKDLKKNLLNSPAYIFLITSSSLILFPLIRVLRCAKIF